MIQVRGSIFTAAGAEALAPLKIEPKRHASSFTLRSLPVWQIQAPLA
jgi:hypothetical protein